MKFGIKAFAVFCVAVTSAYVMVLGWRLNNTLSGPGWCATALGAGKAASKDGTPIKGLEACVGLLTIQLNSLSLNSHILLGTIALCLGVLMVIVVAGAKISGSFDGHGGTIDLVPKGDALPVHVDNKDPIPVTPKPATPPSAPDKDGP